MKIEKKDAEQHKKGISKSVKKAVTLGVMFTLGVSAFAIGNGKLFEKNDWNLNAVDDMCSIIEYSGKANADGIIDAGEKAELEKMFSTYDTNYGKGAGKFVLTESMKYAKELPAGIELSTQGEKGMKAIVQNSVRKVADVQRSMDTINRTSNEKLTLADYEFGR